MPGLPALSGTELIRILKRHGYIEARTRGSHVRLYPREGGLGMLKVTVPLHKQLKAGTLSRIMKDAWLQPDDLRA